MQNMQSMQNMQNMQNIQNIQNMQNMQNMQNIPNIQNMRNNKNQYINLNESYLEELIRPYKEKIEKLENEVKEKQKEIDKLKLKLFQNNSLNKNNQQFMNNMGNPINNQFNNMNMMNNMGNQMNMMNNPMNLMNNNQFNQNNMMNMPNFPLNNNLMNSPNFQMCNLMNFNNNIPSMTQMNNPIKKEVEFLTIIFRMSDEQRNQTPSIQIQCRSDDKMEDIINRFCTKTVVDKKDYKFIFCAKEVLMDSTAEEIGLTNGSNICVVKIGQNEVLKNNIEVNNNNQNAINNNSMSEREIRLFFETFPSIGSKVMIKIDINKTIREAEYKFCEKLGLPYSTLKYLKFTYLVEELNPDMKISQSRLKGNSLIHVIDMNNLIGA